MVFQWTCIALSLYPEPFVWWCRGRPDYKNPVTRLDSEGLSEMVHYIYFHRSKSISTVQNPFPSFKIHFHRSKFISIVQNPFPPGWNWGGRMLATGCSSSPRWKVSLLLLLLLLGPAFAVSLDTPGWNQSRKWFSCHFTYFLVHRTFIIPSSTWQVPSTNPVTSCSSSSR